MSEYRNRLELYLKFLASEGYQVDDFTEFKFESLEDFSLMGGLSDVIAWYQFYVRNTTMTMTRIPLTECREWSVDHELGLIEHSSGEFFRVEGYRISGTDSREVVGGWDQPFLTQQGFDGGILGLIRKRFHGVPHYLVEAKEEPGNYNVVQISPTVQATYSNLSRAHRGNQLHYSDIFLNLKIIQ